MDWGGFSDLEKLGRQCPLSKLWPLPLEWSPHCTEMAVIAVADLSSM